MKRIWIALIFAGCCWGQVSSGSLVGDVRDEKAALLSDVTVTARNDATGFTRSVATSPYGGYRIDELLPGSYTVTAARAGYRSVAASPVIVEVNQKSRFDFELRSGSERDTVTVVSQSAPVQTDDASEGYTFGAGFIGGLPLTGRNIIDLVTLGPGAIPRQLFGFNHDVVNDVQENRGAVALNAPVNGARSTQNGYIVDGAYTTDRNAFSVAVIPLLESVAEFRIQTSLAPAEFPQVGGGVIDIATKSGSKVFHGNAFEYFQNEATDARGFFENPTLPRAIVRQNQYGATLGGPLAKSTYFFASYEGLDGRSSSATQHTVPTTATRGGNFAGGSTIFDPLSLDPSGARTPFPNNAIPVKRLDQNIQKYLTTYEPFPNLPAGGGPDYIDATPNQDRSDNGSFRLDRAWGERNRLFARYTINDERSVLAGSFPELPTAEHTRAQQIVLGHTFATASWLSEAHLSFTRLRVLDLPQDAGGANVMAGLGITTLTSDPIDYGLPSFLVSNYDTIQDSNTLPQNQRDNTWYGSWGLSRTTGRHTWKAGVQFTHFNMAYLQSHLVRGQYIFNGSFSSSLASPNNTGDPFADFLLGYPSQTQGAFGTTQAYLHQNNYAGYVQDDWRLTPRITLSAGLRYEYAGPLTDDRGDLLNLNYSNLPSTPTLQSVKSGINPDYHDFAPRVGLAIRLPRLFGSSRETVFRAGYGIYYSPEIAVETYDLIQNGVKNVLNQPGSTTPVLTIENGFPQTSATGFPSYFGLDPNAATPYVQQWAASLQQELPGRILFGLGYIGSKGTDLGRFRRFNTPQHVETGQDLPLRAGDLQSLRTFPTLGTIFQREHIANSSYNSLQVKAEKRLTGGLSFLSSFVWSKSLDDADSPIAGTYLSWGAQNEADLRAERGRSSFDVPFRFTGGYVYSIPTASRFKTALKNWQVSGNITLQSGMPENLVYFSKDYANSGTPNRPNLVPGQSLLLPASQRNVDHYFNPAAFTAPAPFTFGNAGRNILPTQGSAVVDLAVSRRFAITERQSVQLRAEAFNALNHPNLGIALPYADPGFPYGQSFSAGPPRHMQFALRYDF